MKAFEYAVEAFKLSHVDPQKKAILHAQVCFHK